VVLEQSKVQLLVMELQLMEQTDKILILGHLLLQEDIPHMVVELDFLWGDLVVLVLNLLSMEMHHQHQIRIKVLDYLVVLVAEQVMNQENQVVHQLKHQ